MKTRNFKESYSSGWVQTAVSIVALVFVILTSFGIVTPEQSSQAQPLISTTLGAVSTVIAGIMSLIGIFFKSGE